MFYKISKATAAYTGGGCWVFTGCFENGKPYFIADNDGGVMIVDSDPSNLDISLECDWQEKHMIIELDGHNTTIFYNHLVEYLLTADNEDRGGITDIEIEKMRRC